MKLLILSGTPKTDGLTYSFVQGAAEAAEKAGVEVEIISLAKIGMQKCKMCGEGWGICFKQHKCVFGDKDGFNLVQEKVEKADAYVYITPVYWGEASEDMKLFIDKLRRCQATKKWNREAGNSFALGKPSILVAVAGGGGGGIINTFSQIERAIGHMEGHEAPFEREGVFDYIAVNRWNQDYKRDALKSAVAEMISYVVDEEKEAPHML
jgi:multimeric flavodoxin WrbA